MSDLNALRDQILALPVKDREQLIKDILASFSPKAREAIDKAWVAEARDRIRAYDRGEMASYSVQEVQESLDL